MRDFRDINRDFKPVDFLDVFFVFEDIFEDIIDSLFHHKFEVFQASILSVLSVFLLLVLHYLLVPDPLVLV